MGKGIRIVSREAAKSGDAGEEDTIRLRQGYGATSKTQ
jgi:hypothetical protein